MNRTLFPAEVQLSIFQQLLTYEHLLEAGFFLNIYRYNYGLMKVFLGSKDGWDCIDVYTIDTFSISSARELDEVVTRWWAEVPAECKK